MVIMISQKHIIICSRFTLQPGQTIQWIASNVQRCQSQRVVTALIRNMFSKR
jgi:hypothetical protein